MGTGIRQHQAARQGFAFQARLARLLEMPEKEYAALIREIEADPLFVRLRYAVNGAERAIRSRRLQQTDLSRRFFELHEAVAASSGDGGAEVEKLLDGKEKIVRLIRRIGEDHFKEYFIFNESGLDLGEIAANCGINEREVQEILSLINDIDVYSEFYVPPEHAPAHGVSYHKIAVLTKEVDGIAIQFTSAHWARGLYEVDYAKIERLAASGAVTKDAHKSIKKLLEKIELANIKKSLMHNIISRIIARQSGYFQCHREHGLEPFMQIDLARDMHVHPSIISRATARRSLETPWGEELPLKAFFASAEAGRRERVKRYIAEILEHEQVRMRKGEIKRPMSDEAIAKRLAEAYAAKIAPRTVTKYRGLLNMASSFRRGAFRDAGHKTT